ncbi:MAG: helix-turn-helix domain-containing protein [Clostridiales bacterium]|nr:helix-turn-helix domain-containing protein [Clostridiales bacterium]
MIITRELAFPIVERLEKILGNPVNIINADGIIVASTDTSRVGNRHQGAVEAMSKGKDLRVTKEQSKTLTGTREGITLPLELHGEYIGAVGVTGDPDTLSLTASVIRVAVLSLMEVAQMTQQVSYKRKISDTWVSNLISDRFMDCEQLDKQAKFLEIDCAKPCGIIVIHISPIVYDNISAHEQTILQAAGRHAKVHFFAYVGQGQYVLAVQVNKRDEKAALKNVCAHLSETLGAMRLQCRIGVGRPNSEISGYRQSYFDAYNGAKFAERAGVGNHVVYYYEHNLLRLLESVPELARKIFVSNHIGNREWDPMLLHTLQTYFAMEKHVNETAQALYIHRNTLIFRLNKIRELYGLDPRRFSDSLTLQALLYLTDLSSVP